LEAQTPISNFPVRISTHTENNTFAFRSFRMKRISRSAFMLGLAATFCTFQQQAVAQSTGSYSLNVNDLQNVITTAVPFLLLAPDSRSGALGEAGVAISPDANSIHWNPAKLPFADKPIGLSASYSPWLRNLGINDIGLAYISFYAKIDKLQSFGASLRYFSLGEITFTDQNGNNTGQYKPNEFAVDADYARKLSERFSLAIAGRFIYSNLTLGQYVGGQQTKPGVSAAADIAGYYRKPYRKTGKPNKELALGFNISNLGAKINYTNGIQNNFLPTNLRIGGAYTVDLNEYNRITAILDINKMLVPTPPLYVTDSVTGARVIYKGKDNNVPPLTGVFQSFGDAPGGFKEEMREINFSPAVEYWYNKVFALRAGYHHEAVQKGGRQFLTVGFGVKYSVFGLDFSYLVPTRAASQSPLANTLRFTLKFDFDAFSSNPDAQVEPEPTPKPKESPEQQ